MSSSLAAASDGMSVFLTITAAPKYCTCCYHAIILWIVPTLWIVARRSQFNSAAGCQTKATILGVRFKEGLQRMDPYFPNRGHPRAHICPCKACFELNLQAATAKTRLAFQPSRLAFQSARSYLPADDDR